MFALGMMDENAEWPKYGAFLIFELYKVDGRNGADPE